MDPVTTESVVVLTTDISILTTAKEITVVDILMGIMITDDEVDACPTHLFSIITQRRALAYKAQFVITTVPPTLYAITIIVYPSALIIYSISP